MRRYHGLQVPGAHDELDHLDMLRRQEQAEQSREAPLVRINPPEARNGILGGQQNVTGGGAVIQLVSFQCEDVDTLPLIVTAQTLATQGAGGMSVSPGGFRSFLRVMWGTRGALVQADVDIGRGVQFAVGGSAVVVSAGADASGLATEATFPVTAMLSMRSTARFSPVYRTRYVDSLADATATAMIAIPEFATRLWVMRLGVGGPPQVLPAVLLNVFDVTTTVNIYTATYAATVVPPAPIPIAADAGFVQLTNLAGGALAINARLIFELCL